MNKKGTLWAADELTIALNFYWKIPYNKISGSSNLNIKRLATLIGRTPGAVAYKLMNFTSLDPERRQKGNKGKSSAGSLDKVIWNKYYEKWEDLAYDSTVLISKFRKSSVEKVVELTDDELQYEGLEKQKIIKARINQRDFRLRILASYNQKCCLTNISIPSLLVANHIVPWSIDKSNRLNPKNGLCLNNLHDKAFDKGFLTISDDFRVMLSKNILNLNKEKSVQDLFIKYENQKINLPDRFIPDEAFLKWHRENIFQK